ncbi:unnamed protein product [Meloidogyne enterolobii]|uniref:Uncharacterized protein n=1 Tax=Meloidogyne enterolobii TaxID=390850 RepID=A0ACB0ZQ30_MELEN
MTTNGVNDGRDDDALKAARRTIIPSSYARSLHDTTYAYLRALNKTTEKFGYLTKDLARNGTLINNMSKGEFQGETGNVIIDENGNREPIFVVTMLDISDQPLNVMQINFINNTMQITKNYNDESVIWANRGGKRPLYKPICGYTGTECPQNITTYILIGVGLVLLLLVATLGGIGYAVREKLKEKERLTRECLIPFGELKNIKELKSNEDMRSLEANKSLKSLQKGGKRPLYKPICGYTGTECPQNITTYILIGVGLVLLLLVATLGGIGYAVREKLKEKERLTRECLIPFGELKNIKELKSNEDMRSLEANKSLKSLQSSQSGSTKLTSMDDKKLETENYAHFLYNREVVFAIKYQVRVRIFNEDLFQLMKLRQLDHENLNKFCGLCTDAPILYAVWKHCQRGSLKDLIAKERYVGDSFVMFTLMRDVKF